MSKPKKPVPGPDLGSDRSPSSSQTETAPAIPGDATLPKRRFTIEELVAGMTPDREHPLEDDWPMGEELI